MSYSVAIDPGVRSCGIAIFRGDQLHAAIYLRNCQEHLPNALRCDTESLDWRRMADQVWKWVDFCTNGMPPDTLVIEFPQTYGGRSAKGDTNDLLQLAAVVSAICGRAHAGTRVLTFRPREWKGNVPKSVTKARVDIELTEHERKCVDWPAPSLRHNVYDAIAIGLRHVGR